MEVERNIPKKSQVFNQGGMIIILDNVIICRSTKIGRVGRVQIKKTCKKA